jgi:hypothetical protein
MQARRGYFAPKDAEEADAAAENENVKQVMFSDRESAGLPANISVKFEKMDAHATKFSVIAALDMRSLSFRKEAG